MAAMNVPLPSTEPALRIDDVTLRAVAEKFAPAPRPWIVLGIGASHPDKDWPDENWAGFIAALRGRTTGTVFLIGGEANVARAQNFIAASARRIGDQCVWPRSDRGGCPAPPCRSFRRAELRPT